MNSQDVILLEHLTKYELDSNSNQLKSDALEIIAEHLECQINDIVDIKSPIPNPQSPFFCTNNNYILIKNN